MSASIFCFSSCDAKDWDRPGENWSTWPFRPPLKEPWLCETVPTFFDIVFRSLDWFRCDSFRPSVLDCSTDASVFGPLLWAFCPCVRLSGPAFVSADCASDWFTSDRLFPVAVSCETPTS